MELGSEDMLMVGRVAGSFIELACGFDLERSLEKDV